jgi:hypothetical protein
VLRRAEKTRKVVRRRRSFWLKRRDIEGLMSTSDGGRRDGQLGDTVDGTCDSGGGRWSTYGILVKCIPARSQSAIPTTLLEAGSMAAYEARKPCHFRFRA